MNSSQHSTAVTLIVIVFHVGVVGRHECIEHSSVVAVYVNTTVSLLWCHSNVVVVRNDH